MPGRPKDDQVGGLGGREDLALDAPARHSERPGDTASRRCALEGLARARGDRSQGGLRGGDVEALAFAARGAHDVAEGKRCESEQVLVLHEEAGELGSEPHRERCRGRERVEARGGGSTARPGSPRG